METFFQSVVKLARLDTILEAKKDSRIRRAVGDVIGLVLRKPLAEMTPGILGSRMALKGKIPAIESIQVIETDRKLGTESFSKSPEDRLLLLEHQEVKGDFQQPAVALKNQTVLGRNQLKRPGKVRRFRRESGKMSFHPLS